MSSQATMLSHFSMFITSFESNSGTDSMLATRNAKSVSYANLARRTCAARSEQLKAKA